MTWWKRLLGLSYRPEETEIKGSGESAPRGPALILLMSDAASLAALRTVSFEDAKEAAEYIEFWNPKRNSGALHPFWALAGEPIEGWTSEMGERGEALVLIRDEMRGDVVYPFSFTDMATALMFLRQEISSGIAFERICVYWAITVDVSYSDSGRVTLSPSAPPSLAEHNEVPETNEFVFDTKTTFARKDDSETAEPVSNEHTSGVGQWVPRFPVLSQRMEGLELRENSVEEFEEHLNVAPMVPVKTNGTPVAQNGAANGFSNGQSLDEPTRAEGDHEEKTPDIDNDGVQGDIGKIQRWRRLERHDGPFEGFDSPHDRF